MAEVTELKTEILEAIGAHGVWKMRLRTAVEMGGKGLQPDVICRDDQCRFGQWLHTLPASMLNQPDVRAVRDLHSRFHAVAGNVARDIVDGNSPRGMQSIQSGDFAKTSTDLMMALEQWRKAA